MVRQAPTLPSDLKAASRRFEKWRTTRSCRSRIPDVLWDLAVHVAQARGIYRVAKTLRLDFQSIKRRVASAKPPSPREESISPLNESMICFILIRPETSIRHCEKLLGDMMANPEPPPQQ